MRLETINITKIVNGGYGFARLATGQVTLVRHVLANETVIITTEEAKKNHIFGKVQQILKEHPARRIPPCKYSGQCGGCDLQHCDYDTQLIIKRGIVEDLLRRQNQKAVVESINLLTAPIPSPSTFAYRQRIRLQVGDRGTVGFHRFRSHDIIPIDRCLLAGESINSTLTALQGHEDGHKLCELSTEVELQLNPETGKTVCIFHFIRKLRPADAKSAQRFCRDVNEIERIFFIGTDFPITGPYFDAGKSDYAIKDNLFTAHYPTITKANRPVDLSWEAGGFCQVNLDQNKKLIETVLEFCQVEKTETVLDLYCGMGNFSIPFAMEAKEVFGIEGQGSAIRSAKNNAANNKLTNTRFLKSPVHGACLELADKGAQFDCVLIDPPRQGAPGLARQLAAITAKRLVYISCDPATLCRDLADLTEEGFTICKIQPLDMFPQTHHIETIVLLKK
ncbi:MAG: 23S rRNA (uracil(1939)-C(5))-methyltransferase RlmD [Desulfobulbaceae bacterium]|nr:23S rRNA (uracil(1939)-C(5))-methyltransferase RlmD [Desulfobulbaceae bacterium]